MSDLVTSVWSVARGILGTVAPTIATALGGPLAGSAVQKITQALGLNVDASPEEITQVLQKATPEQLLALKKQDQEYAVEMRKLDVDLDRLVYSDRADARARSVQTNDRSTYVLAWVTVVAVFSMIFLILTGVAKVEGEFVATVVGVALAVFKDIYGFFYGSSMGSKQKTLELVQQSGAR